MARSEDGGASWTLLDDLPIMTIAYDNTPVSENPIRWQMPKLLGVSAVLGSFSVVQSFGTLLIGMEVLSDPDARLCFGLWTRPELQTAMFPQLVVGGHLLMFVTRTEGWFFLPPFPAAPLFTAIALTQTVAIAMCGLGWLVEPIGWKLIAWIWAYDLAWLFVLGGVRLITERFAEYRTARHSKSVGLVSHTLQPHVPGIGGSGASRA